VDSIKAIQAAINGEDASGSEHVGKHAIERGIFGKVFG
jgi:hypothetical protein